MCSSVLSKVWKDEIRVLIDFIRVLWAEASLGRERELGDTVVKLFLSLRTLSWLRYWLRSRDLTSDRCS